MGKRGIWADSSYIEEAFFLGINTIIIFLVWKSLELHFLGGQTLPMYFFNYTYLVLFFKKKENNYFIMFMDSVYQKLGKGPVGMVFSVPRCLEPWLGRTEAWERLDGWELGFLKVHPLICLTVDAGCQLRPQVMFCGT